LPGDLGSRGAPQGLAGRVITQLERAGRFVLDAFGFKGDVRGAGGDQARGDILGRLDAFRFAVRDQALDVGTATLPAHWTTT
jgi:hypothetical protein